MEWHIRCRKRADHVVSPKHKILDAQPNRQHVYGFVTNNEKLILSKATRAETSPFQVIWEISTVLTYSEGMQLFIELMADDHGYRPNPLINSSTVSIKKPLRPGGSCRAYVGKFQGKEVVVKVYTSTMLANKNKKNMESINNALENINDGGAVLPTICGQSENWLLVEPQGVPFAPTSFSRAHLKSVLNTLEKTHTVGYVHRDVRMANMFDLGSEKLLLNDWGSLARMALITPYEGCPVPFMHPSLQDVCQGFHNPLPKHDLYSLVYSVAKLIAPGFSSEAIQEVFSASFRAADNLEYDKVYESMESKLIC